MNGTIPLPRHEEVAWLGIELCARQRSRVLLLLAEVGPRGLSRSEVHDLYVQAFGEPLGGPEQIGKRLAELENSGCAERRRAWIVTAKGAAWVETQK